MHNIESYIWNFINKFGTQIVWLITTIILARYLSPEDFGMIGVLSLVFMVANTLSEAGLGGALIIQKEIREKDCSTIFTFNMVVSCMLYIVVFLLSNSIERFYEVEGLSNITRIICIVFVINALACVPRTILCHRLQFKQLCVITIVSVIISSIITIAMAISGFGVYALVAYQIILSILQVIGFFWLSKYRIKVAFYWNNFRSLFSFGFFTTVCGVVDTIYENLLGAIYGKSFNMTQAGYLSQAKKIEEASTQALLSSVNNTAFPVLAKFKDDKCRFKNESKTIMKLIPLVTFPILIVLLVFSKEAVLILFGEKWLDAAPYLSLLVIAGMFMIMDSLTRNAIKSLGQVKVLLYSTIIKRVLACLLVILIAIISPNIILIGYILGAMFGVLINLFAFHKLGYITLWEVICEFIRPFVWTIPLWGIIYACYLFIPVIIGKVAITIVTLALYYVITLRACNVKLHK